MYNNEYQIKYSLSIHDKEELDKVNTLLRTLPLTSCVLKSVSSFTDHVYICSEHKVESVSCDFHPYSGTLICENREEKFYERAVFQLAAAVFPAGKNFQTKMFTRQWEKTHPGKTITQIEEYPDTFSKGLILLYKEKYMNGEEEEF